MVEPKPGPLIKTNKGKGLIKTNNLLYKIKETPLSNLVLYHLPCVVILRILTIFIRWQIHVS